MKYTPLPWPAWTLCLTLLATGSLFAQTEWAVMIREAGTKKTYYGDGRTATATHDSRLFGVSTIDFSDSFARPATFRAVLHAKKDGKKNVFAPRPLADEPEYQGTSWLLNAGKTGWMDMQALVSQDPAFPLWIFPQGKASSVQLVTDGALRSVALRYASPFAFGVKTDEEIAVNAAGFVLTLDPALSRELNALSPSDYLDARNKLINLLLSKGWINKGENSF
jgi:hypothetical protein